MVVVVVVVVVVAGVVVVVALAVVEVVVEVVVVGSPCILGRLLLWLRSLGRTLGAALRVVVSELVRSWRSATTLDEHLS